MTTYTKRRAAAEAILIARGLWCGHAGWMYAIDHVTGGRAGYRRATGRRATLDAVRDINNGLVENYRLLCPPCHYDKTSDDRMTGHLAQNLYV
jgi:hypothetical protein